MQHEPGDSGSGSCLLRQFLTSNCVVSPDPRVAARHASRWAAMPRQWRKDLPGALPFSRVRRVRSCALVYTCHHALPRCSTRAVSSVEPSDDRDRVRILVVGGHGTGRTCLVRRFLERAYAPGCRASSTTGTRVVTVDEKDVVITVRQAQPRCWVLFPALHG